MSYVSKKSYSKRSEFSVIYNNFGGVDFSEDGIDVSRSRFAHLENMYRDYDSDGGMVESIPGYRAVYDTLARPCGLYSYKNSDNEDIIALHAQNSIYQIPLNEIDNPKNVVVTSGVSEFKGDAYRTNDSLFVLDGSGIFKLSKEFSGKVTGEDSGVYIPTTHVDGVEYEQRNLLTRFFYEKYNLSAIDSMSYGTPTLRYMITNEEKRECSVIGTPYKTPNIFIPSRVMIGDTYYSVKSIDDFAFKDNQYITSCHIACGVTTIGKGAFSNCSMLTKVVISDTVTDILDICFRDCSSLSELHLGKGIKTLGDAFINTCPLLKTVTYSSSSEDFDKIVNSNYVLSGREVVYHTKNNFIKIGLKIHNPAIDITKITVDSSNFSFEEVKSNGICTEVTVNFNDKNLYNGKTLILRGLMSENKDDYSNYPGFVSSIYSGKESIHGVIGACRIAESFDGRIFLTGNPDYPGFCFYSSFDLSGENNPLYFGEMNYFKDGVGNFNNTALLSAGDSLAVFKEGDDGGGSIYYHVPESTGINILPKIYPVSYVHTGFIAKGKAISFFDDPLFVSSKGISALAKKNINLERSVETRSSNVNNKLLSENLKEIDLTIWRGYLVALVNGRMYLADSRAKFINKFGESEYEWYYISGVGSYRNDYRVFKYSASAHDGYSVHENVEMPVKETVYSIRIGNELIYYTYENGICYEAHPTGEKYGGTFTPAVFALSVEDKLIFVSADGQILVFNTDKKGVPPPDVQNSAGFDEEEYREEWGKTIHPYYYSYDGHPIRYALQTKRDDCSIPHLLKSSVKNSLSIKCKAVSGGKITCEVGTDNGGYKEITNFPSKKLFFADIDFSSFSMSTDDIYTVPIHEKEKGWIEKQITLYSEEFASPFAICMIAYRFYVKGKIKRNR